MALLSEAQLEEFSSNVYDELRRRDANSKEIWKEGPYFPSTLHTPGLNPVT